MQVTAGRLQNAGYKMQATKGSHVDGPKRMLNTSTGYFLIRKISSFPRPLQQPKPKERWQFSNSEHCRCTTPSCNCTCHRQQRRSSIHYRTYLNRTPGNLWSLIVCQLLQPSFWNNIFHRTGLLCNFDRLQRIDNIWLIRQSERTKSLQLGKE